MPVLADSFFSETRYTEYYKAIQASMFQLSLRSDTLFIGQQVRAQDFYGTLVDVPLDKRIEMPVAEEMQMGFCTGLALEGFLPICIFQRMDFLYRAMDQMCNHLSLLPEMSRGVFRPKVIIRTTIGNDCPLNPGPQHTQDLTTVFQEALRFPVIRVQSPEEVKNAYEFALESDTSTLIIEDQKLYSEECIR